MTARKGIERYPTGVRNLDALLRGGLPSGTLTVLAGPPGSGKTILAQQIGFTAAAAGRRVIYFQTLSEPTAKTLQYLSKFSFFSAEQLETNVTFIDEEHLLMMRERIESMGARRVAVDSISVFLHKTTDPLVVREKVFQLASVVQNVGAVGFFSSDIPYGSARLSRSGVEETVVDGITLLTSVEEGMERRRYLEIYKLRNTAHLDGRHAFTIGSGGIHVFPRYAADTRFREPPPPVDVTHRLSTGIAKLDALLGGGLLKRSVTLVSGSAGIGKSTLAAQFLVDGAARGEPGLYIALEESPAQILASADALGLPLREAVERGCVEVVYLAQQSARDAQLLAVLTETIAARRAQRLVLDSASHLMRDPEASDALPQLLADLVVRLKTLGVTSLFTLESKLLYGTDTVTDRGLSPIADNLLMLRYAEIEGALRNTLLVVKTRGSASDSGRHAFTLARGGVSIGERVLMPKEGGP